MAVWLITGRLGSGKTLGTIDRIRKHLRKGLRVATNLDLNLDHLMPGWDRSTVIRVPDLPSAEDLWSLGRGSATPNEEEFGLLVLDELAAWLNARSWNEAGRKEVVDWMIHARKQGWHVILIAQHADLIDKQLRRSLVEFVGVCRRLDRMKFLGFRLPRLHLAIVRYGTEQFAPIAERWLFRGAHYYKAYDTRQVFDRETSPGMHSMLSAWHLKGRYMTQGKLYRPLLLGGLIGGAVLGLAAGVAGGSWYFGRNTEAAPMAAQPSTIAGLPKYSAERLVGHYRDGGAVVVGIAGESGTRWVRPAQVIESTVGLCIQDGGRWIGRGSKCEA